MSPTRLTSRVLAGHLAITLVALVACLVIVGVTPALGAVALVLLALAGLLSLLLARSLTRSIDQLTGWVDHLANGQPSVRPPVLEIAELTGLAASLGVMAGQLRTRIEDVAQERDRARQILAALDSGVLLLDEEGGLRYANATARAWFGLGDAGTGLPARRILGAPELNRLVEEAAASGEPATGELTLIFPEHRTLGVRATPLIRHSATTGVVVTLVDLTGQRRLEALRRDFVANASHELKTPVAAIRVLAEGLESAVDDDPVIARRFISRISREAERQENLVKDLLDLSRVERGTLVTEQVDLAGLGKEIVGRYADRAVDREVELRAELDDKATMRGDRAQVELLISNLIDNALRYTQAGGRVVLTVSTDDEHVTVVVADTGRGIPSRDLPRVFERFYRIDKARERQTGGTGLGLAIVRHVAETHGGSVTVESELGRGTTFTATLPVSGPDEST